MKLFPITTVLAALVLGGGLAAQTAEDAAPPSEEEMQAAMTTPAAFAERAASANRFEIQSSELALELSQSDAVRAFAEKMVADHRAAGERMTEAAGEEGVTPVEALMPDHQSQLDNLSALAPADFDAAYLSAQLAAHVEAVTLFGGYADRGPEGALKTFAAETLPKLQEHRAEVEPLAQP